MNKKFVLQIVIITILLLCLNIGVVANENNEDNELIKLNALVKERISNIEYKPSSIIVEDLRYSSDQKFDDVNDVSMILEKLNCIEFRRCNKGSFETPNQIRINFNDELQTIIHICHGGKVFISNKNYNRMSALPPTIAEAVMPEQINDMINQLYLFGIKGIQNCSGLYSVADVHFRYNGQYIYFNKPAIMIDDCTYVPLRELCNKFDIGVNWDDGKKRIDLTTKIESQNSSRQNSGMINSPNPDYSKRQISTLKYMDRELSLSDFAFINSSMSEKEIADKVGEPNFSKGSSGSWLVYVLSDGSELNIRKRNSADTMSVYLEMKDITLKFAFDENGSIVNDVIMTPYER